MLSSEKRNSVYQCIPIGLITMDYMANTQNTPTYVSVRSLCIVFTCFWDVAPHKHNWSQRCFTVGMRLIHLLKFSLLSFSQSLLSPLSFSPLVLYLCLCGVVLGRVQRPNEAVLMGPQVLKLQQAAVDPQSNWSNHLADWSKQSVSGGHTQDEQWQVFSGCRTVSYPWL